MAKKVHETQPLTLAPNGPAPDKPTPDVQWADLMQFGLMPLTVPKQYGEGAHVVYQTKSGKLMDCTIRNILGESSDGKFSFVLAQLPPKEPRTRKTPEERAQAKALDLVSAIKALKEQGLI